MEGAGIFDGDLVAVSADAEVTNGRIKVKHVCQTDRDGLVISVWYEVQEEGNVEPAII